MAVGRSHGAVSTAGTRRPCRTMLERAGGNQWPGVPPPASGEQVRAAVERAPGAPVNAAVTRAAGAPPRLRRVMRRRRRVFRDGITARPYHAHDRLGEAMGVLEVLVVAFVPCRPAAPWREYRAPKSTSAITWIRSSRRTSMPTIIAQRTFREHDGWGVSTACTRSGPQLSWSVFRPDQTPPAIDVLRRRDGLPRDRQAGGRNLLGDRGHAFEHQEICRTLDLEALVRQANAMARCRSFDDVVRAFRAMRTLG